MDNQKTNEILHKIKENPDNLNKENLVKYLENLPIDRKREYEIQIDELIKLERDHILENTFKEILKSDYPESVRYAAFYSLCIILRRQKDYSKYYNLIDEYRDDFGTRITFHHLESMCLRELNDKAHIKRSIDIARKAKDEVYEI